MFFKQREMNAIVHLLNAMANQSCFI